MSTHINTFADVTSWIAEHRPDVASAGLLPAVAVKITACPGRPRYGDASWHAWLVRHTPDIIGAALRESRWSRIISG